MVIAVRKAIGSSGNKGYPLNRERSGKYLLGRVTAVAAASDCDFCGAQKSLADLAVFQSFSCANPTMGLCEGRHLHAFPRMSQPLGSVDIFVADKGNKLWKKLEQGAKKWRCLL